MTSGLGPTQYRCETKALGLDMFAYDWRTNNWEPVLGRSRWHFCHEQVVQNGQVLQDNTIRAKDPVSVVLSANSLRCYNNDLRDADYASFVSLLARRHQPL